MKFNQLFSDPYSIDDSYQLSGKMIGTDKLSLIEYIKDADNALVQNNFKEFKACFGKIISSIPDSKHRRSILYRIIYNHINLKSFEPVISRLDIGSTEGRFRVESLNLHSLHQEISVNFKSLSCNLTAISKKYFTSIYGVDYVRSELEWRYREAIKPFNNQQQALDKHNEVNKTDFGYIHLDEKKGITTIMYLSKSTEMNGAFRYIDGSHNGACSPVLKALHEFVYNDLGLQTYEQVKDFPAEYRAGINYYYWLEPEKQRAMDDLVKIFAGQAGSTISFAGNRLLHGGGFPFYGSRSAILIQHVGLFMQRARVHLHPFLLANRVGLL